MPSHDAVEAAIPHSPFVPFYRDSVSLYLYGVFPFAVPYEYTGWRDESMSWKASCYLHGNLNPSPTYRIRGPEALKFLSDTCVNSFGNFPVGSGKHAIMCNEDGLVMIDGVLLRLGEDDFITYWMAPYIGYALSQGRYDAVGEDLTGKAFLFQLAGPRALEVLEAATGQDFHDLAFMRHREIRMEVASRPVRVLRMGMGGSLAYELHGDVEGAQAVYGAIFEAGAPFGLRRLGLRAYMLNHTENGFPQAYYHFPYPWREDSGFAGYLDSVGGGGFGDAQHFGGSMGDDIRLRYRNPVELGWEKMIRFDHDFVGRAALEKEVASPRRRMVTLEWNSDDLVDIYASQFRPGNPYPAIDNPNHFGGDLPKFTYFADKVLKDGKVVGVSSGRANSFYYRRMISLCSVDTEHSAPGTELSVLWGDPGTRQKEIRATVARFPYFDENRNQALDVNAIPRVAAATAAS